VSEVRDPAEIVTTCERYWRRTGVPQAAIEDMRLELRQHLEAALSDGKTIDAVVGPSLTDFAEAWATEYRRTPAPDLANKPRTLLAYGVGAASLVGGVIAGSVAAGGGDQVENEVWRWVWTVFALVMGVGEIFTAGFFLLPFAIGAVAAAILAWLGISILAQWLVFFGVSIVALVYLRKFIDRQDQGEQPRVGANRWVGAEGIVLDAVDPLTGAGMVKVEGEEWRATSDTAIDIDTKVIVREVRGARLVVMPIENE